MAKKLQFLDVLETAQMLQQAEQNLQEQEVKLAGKRRKARQVSARRNGLALYHHLPGGLCGIPGRVVDLDCDPPLAVLRTTVGAGLARDAITTVCQ